MAGGAAEQFIIRFRSGQCLCPEQFAGIGIDPDHCLVSFSSVFVIPFRPVSQIVYSVFPIRAFRVAVIGSRLRRPCFPVNVIEADVFHQVFVFIGSCPGKKDRT